MQMAMDGHSHHPNTTAMFLTRPMVSLVRHLSLAILHQRPVMILAPPWTAVGRALLILFLDTPATCVDIPSSKKSESDH
jgi:hypothetical protein